MVVVIRLDDPVPLETGTKHSRVSSAAFRQPREDWRKSPNVSWTSIAFAAVFDMQITPFPCDEAVEFGYQLANWGTCFWIPPAYIFNFHTGPDGWVGRPD